jgi:PAS domain S-box-containing protein
MSRLKRWPDLSLRSKGLMVLAIPALATVIAACASLMLEARIAALHESLDHGTEINERIWHLLASESAASTNMRAYLITADGEFLNKARDSFAAFDAARQRLSGLIADSPAQTSSLERIASLERSRVERLFGESARFQSGAAWPELRATLSAAESERLRMESILQAMQNDQKRLLEATARRIAPLRAAQYAIAAICVLFGVIGGAVASLLFAAGITRRIGRLRENVAQLASGAVLAPWPGGGDELGALCEGVAATAGILRQRTVALENALQGIAEADAAGRYVSFNKAYAALAGLGQGNLPPTIVATVHSGDQAGVEAAIGPMRTDGQAETDARIVHPGGRVVDVAIAIRPVSESGAGYYVFLRDISLRKET